ncbi:MAG: dienelactone hydrolase family protein [Chloroflexota bacterium]|nr:dienelactone hydrolase family protein [Chloroflexota bacterium]
MADPKNRTLPGVPGPHPDGPIRTAGASLAVARAAAVLVHGRGATAADILGLAEEFGVADVAYLAPQAARHTWYPNSFFAPLSSNEPGLSSGLATVGAVLAAVAAAGVPAERTALLGFSQGACLALEYAARHARRYGALVGLSGGLIGPPGTPRTYGGSLAGTPVFLGCSDRDPHIPRARVEESAAVCEALGAVVTLRIYPNMGHTVNRDEITAVRTLLAALVAP